MYSCIPSTCKLLECQYLRIDIMLVIVSLSSLGMNCGSGHSVLVRFNLLYSVLLVLHRNEALC